MRGGPLFPEGCGGPHGRRRAPLMVALWLFAAGRRGGVFANFLQPQFTEPRGGKWALKLQMSLFKSTIFFAFLPGADFVQN